MTSCCLWRTGIMWWTVQSVPSTLNSASQPHAWRRIRKKLEPWKPLIAMYVCVYVCVYVCACVCLCLQGILSTLDLKAIQERNIGHLCIKSKPLSQSIMSLCSIETGNARYLKLEGSFCRKCLPTPLHVIVM